jgi:uncharacterized protein YecE (DUF72 family)
MKGAGTIRIGISGWRYGGWRGVFYPGDLAQRRELEYASRAFPTIEINGTFYSLQRPESFARWADDTPEDFVFAVKGSRFITHMKQLRDIDTALPNFFASGVLRLDKKLGPLLWQFSPRFRFDPERLERFFRILPRDTEQALALARRHDRRVKGRAWLGIGTKRRLRYAVEIRHESFVTPEFITLLRKHRIALVVADAPEWPFLTDVTADFVYCRLHGTKRLYVDGYGPKALDRWAKRVTAWSHGGELADDRRASAAKPPRRRTRDVYIYFDNDAKVRAPRDARALIARLASNSNAPLTPR